MTDKSQAPVLNINGSSYQTLREDYLATIRVIQEAEKKLSAIYPHGRDFQTVDGGLYQKARNEADARLKKIRDVLNEIENIAKQIVDQQLARKGSM